MRTLIEALNVDGLDWSETPAPGLFVKMLNQDKENGAHTAVYRLSPADGYQAPTCPHYHHTYEEIVPLTGSFTFDHRTWMEPGGYVYHPPFTVHGFKSGIRAESTFLTRVGQSLDFNYVDSPAQDDIYLVEGLAPSRPPSVHGAALEALGASEARFLGAAAEATVLSRDGISGEGSAMLTLPGSWQGATAPLDHYLELFVLDGELRADGAAVPRGSYFFYPPGTRIALLEAAGPVTLFASFGGEIGL